jgi:hypothetical protein
MHRKATHGNYFSRAWLFTAEKPSLAVNGASAPDNAVSGDMIVLDTHGCWSPAFRSDVEQGIDRLVGQSVCLWPYFRRRKWRCS